MCVGRQEKMRHMPEMKNEWVANLMRGISHPKRSRLAIVTQHRGLYCSQILSLCYPDLGPVRSSFLHFCRQIQDEDIRRLGAARAKCWQGNDATREAQTAHLFAHNILILFGDTNERKYFNFAPMHMRVCVCGVCGKDRSLAYLFFNLFSLDGATCWSCAHVFLYQYVLQHSARAVKSLLLQQILSVFALLIFSALHRWDRETQKCD